MTDDKTVKVSFRILESKMKEIKEYGEKKGFLKDSEIIRHLLNAGLESGKAKEEVQQDGKD